MRHSIGNTKHIWDSGNIVGDITGSTYKQYFRALNLIYSLVGTTKQYYRYNGHGDVIALTNATGTVVKTYTYNAFGEEQNIDNLDANPFRYCGEYYDKVSSTLYLRARNYNASIGRFTQEDPIRDGGNWYSYCASDPVNFVDPNGEALIRNTNVMMTDSGSGSKTSSYVRSGDPVNAIDPDGEALIRNTNTLMTDSGNGSETSSYVRADDSVSGDSHVHEEQVEHEDEPKVEIQDDVLSNKKSETDDKEYDLNEIIDIDDTQTEPTIWEKLTDVGEKVIEVGAEVFIIGTTAISIVGTIAAGVTSIVGTGGVGAIVAAPAVAVAVEAEVALATGCLTSIALGVAASTVGNIGDNAQNEKSSSIKKIKQSKANDVAKEFGYDDAEALKKDFVGKEGGKFNIMIDTNSRELILQKISDPNIQIHTGFFWRI